MNSESSSFPRCAGLDRTTRTKRRTIVKSEAWSAFSKSKLSLECIDLLPVFKHALFRLGKADTHSDCLLARVQLERTRDLEIVKEETEMDKNFSSGGAAGQQGSIFVV